MIAVSNSCLILSIFGFPRCHLFFFLSSRVCGFGCRSKFRTVVPDLFHHPLFASGRLETMADTPSSDYFPGEKLSSNPVKYEIVFVRHGESTWNLEGLFTGWTDVGLSERGFAEIGESAKMLRDAGRTAFDVAHTSLLKRAIHTLWGIQRALGLEWIPVRRSWRMNERMYGDLQGLSKRETAEIFGAEQVQIWRRAFDVPPPEIKPDHNLNPAADPRYMALPRSVVPRTESLKDVVVRVKPYWLDAIAPDILAGQRVLVVAHGNSLRALLQLIFQIPETEIVKLNIPTGIPLTIALDEGLIPVSRTYLVDREKLDARIAATKALSTATPAKTAP